MNAAGPHAQAVHQMLVGDAELPLPRLPLVNEVHAKVIFDKHGAGGL